VGGGDPEGGDCWLELNQSKNFKKQKKIFRKSVYLCVWASDFGCHGDTSVTSLLAPPPFCFFFIRWWMISIGFKRIEINWIKPPWIYKFLFEFFFFGFLFWLGLLRCLREYISIDHFCCIFFFGFCVHTRTYLRAISRFISPLFVFRDWFPNKDSNNNNKQFRF